MLPWLERPVEVATMLNPAFCAVLLHKAIEAYEREQNRGMAYPLVFLFLPLVLHKDTRTALPRSQTKQVTLYQWVEDNKLLRQNFVKRTRYLVPYTTEGLIFSIKQGFVRISNARGQEGYLLPTEKSFIQKPSWDKKSEVALCCEKAQLLGNWFAKAGRAARVFEILGIRL